jgi:hypothetical protein
VFCRCSRSHEHLHVQHSAAKADLVSSFSLIFWLRSGNS